MIDNPWLDYSLTAFAFLLLTGYHVRLLYRIRHAPLTTTIGLNIHTRRAWVETVMEERLDLLAVQTLRNWAMAASFLATTAILISLGILNIALMTSANPEVSQAVTTLVHRGGELWLVKLVLLAATFFFAFFNFTLAIRSYNHVGVMINIPPKRDPLITPELVINMVGRGMNHYSLGMRGYYFAVPLVMWLFGTLWLLSAALVMVLVLRKIDHGVD
ncbi:MAG: DUF599 domain-containing protein [Pseudomonadota bacterium]